MKYKRKVQRLMARQKLYDELDARDKKDRTRPGSVKK